MSKMVMVGSKSTDDSQVMQFSGASLDQVSGKVALFMASRGYRLESGTKEQGVYGKGSAGAHAMLGPLVKRQKYNITIVDDGDHISVVVAKGMSGMGGGLLSAGKVKKEFQEIISGLQETILS